MEKTILDGFVKSPPASLRGAKRRGNLLDIRAVMRLLRFARNDKSAFFGLFTTASILGVQKTKNVLKSKKNGSIKSAAPEFPAPKNRSLDHKTVGFLMSTSTSAFVRSNPGPHPEAPKRSPYAPYAPCALSPGSILSERRAKSLEQSVKIPRLSCLPSLLSALISSNALICGPHIPGGPPAMSQEIEMRPGG